jgi:hypothetical protein
MGVAYLWSSVNCGNFDSNKYSMSATPLADIKMHSQVQLSVRFAPLSAYPGPRETQSTLHYDAFSWASLKPKIAHLIGCFIKGNFS